MGNLKTYGTKNNDQIMVVFAIYLFPSSKLAIIYFNFKLISH